MSRRLLHPHPLGRPAVAGSLAGLLAPPRCLGCRKLVADPLDLGLCSACRARLAVPPPAVSLIHGLEWVEVAAHYAPGPARAIVAALKSGRVPRAAGTAAELICEAQSGRIGPEPWGSSPLLVPVPAAPIRRLRRGLDPGEQIAGELARRLRLRGEVAIARIDGRPQRGRTRARRLADPPRFEAARSLPETVILVDDVVTTGATLRSCAEAAARAGATRIAALCFAFTPRPRARERDAGLQPRNPA